MFECEVSDSKQEALLIIEERKLDAPLAAWCADRELDPYLKEAQCKRYDHRTHAPLLRSYGGEHLSSFTDVDSPVAAVSDVATHEGDDPAGSGVSDDAQLAIVKLADRFGQFVQLDCVGFLSNKRQHRQFGLAVVQIAQRLRRHWHARASVAAREQRGGAGLRFRLRVPRGGRGPQRRHRGPTLSLCFSGGRSDDTP